MSLQELAEKAGIPQSEVDVVVEILEGEIRDGFVERTPETQEAITKFWKKLVSSGVFNCWEVNTLS